MWKCGSCSNKLKSADNNVCYKCCYEELERIKMDARLMSKVLMYSKFNRNSASKEDIVRTMYGFFNSDELRAAKSLVYERLGSLDIVHNAADRRTPENRSDLMEENIIPCVSVSSNWKRLPKINPAWHTDWHN